MGTLTHCTPLTKSLARIVGRQFWRWDRHSRTCHSSIITLVIANHRFNRGGFLFIRVFCI